MKLFITLFIVSFPIKVQVPSGHKPYIFMAVSLELKTMLAYSRCSINICWVNEKPSKVLPPMLSLKQVSGLNFSLVKLVQSWPTSPNADLT